MEAYLRPEWFLNHLTLAKKQQQETINYSTFRFSLAYIDYVRTMWRCCCAEVFYWQNRVNRVFRKHFVLIMVEPGRKCNQLSRDHNMILEKVSYDEIRLNLIWPWQISDLEMAPKKCFKSIVFVILREAPPPLVEHLGCTFFYKLFKKLVNAKRQTSTN